MEDYRRNATPDERQELLAVSNFNNTAMAYIDDEMAYHAVGNPFDEPAISLHAYTSCHWPST